MKWIMYAVLISMAAPLAHAKPKMPECLFKVQDIVTLRTSNIRGQVVEVYQSEWENSLGQCEYLVKFITSDIYTDTHLFSKDGPVTRGILIQKFWLQQWELVKQ